MKTKLSFALPILLASLAGVLWWQPSVVTQGATMIASSAGLVPLSGTTGGAVNATIVSGVATTGVDAIATTSTDGIVIQNTTAATGGATVQMSPRLRWRGNAWDTAASQTVDFFAENIPATAATPTGTWKLGYSLNGAAATYPLTVSSSGSMTTLGSITSTINLVAGAANNIFWTGRAILKSPANGIVTVNNQAETIGAEFKVDALPVASSCGAGSPAVVAGSTPWNGSVTVGTGGPATCTITWGGTAYPSAPNCTGSVATSTGANARMMGYLGATTTLTIVPSAAWADGSVVTWVCPSSK